MSRRITAVLIDLSGTIHIEDSVISNSIQALTRLRESKVKIKFVTNTTKESKTALHSRLTRIGFSIEKNEIFTSLVAARSLIEKKQLRPHLLVAPEALEEFDGITTDDPNAVVIGLAPTVFDYENMTKAFRLLMDGASLIGIHKARYYKRADGLALGPGAFVSALEYSSGVKAEIVGKPEESFFLSALSELGCDPSSAVMIGDDAKDDVAGAIKAGCLGILVKTGKYRLGDEAKVDPAPTHIADDFPSAVDYILANYKLDTS